MSFVGVTFDGQNVSPKDDGALYGCHYGDGIIDGCAMSVTSSSLVIQSGHIIAGGRQCKVDGATELDLSAVTENYVQVYLQYDVSQAEGEQWDWGYKEQASLPFGALTQEDINGTGNIYQVQLAILETSGGNITAINRSMHMASLIVRDTNGGYATINLQDIAGTFIQSYNSNGVLQGGIQFTNDGRQIIYGNGTNYIQLRPNGRTDVNGQVSFGTDGQQINGHTFGIMENSTATNKTNGYSAIQNYQFGTGLYLLQAQATLRPTAAGVFSLHIGYNAGAADFVTGRQALYCSNTTDYWAFNVFAIINETALHNYTMYIYGQTGYSLTHWKYAWTRLA